MKKLLTMLTAVCLAVSLAAGAAGESPEADGAVTENKALQLGEASKVVPIDKLSVVITLILAFVFLHEEFTAKSVLGCVLIGAGTLLMVL